MKACIKRVYAAEGDLMWYGSTSTLDLGLSPQPSALSLKSEWSWTLIRKCGHSLAYEGTVQQSQVGPNTFHMLADINSVRGTTFLHIWPNFFP